MTAERKDDIIHAAKCLAGALIGLCLCLGAAAAIKWVMLWQF